LGGTVALAALAASGEERFTICGACTLAKQASTKSMITLRWVFGLRRAVLLTGQQQPRLDDALAQRGRASEECGAGKQQQQAASIGVVVRFLL